MSDVIDRPTFEQEARAKPRLRIIDCDIHPSLHPRSSPLIARRDAWPTGGPPGSDLAFMRKQHLDPLEIEFGILQVLDLFIFSQQNLECGAAIQRAINEWQLAQWTRRDPRLKASILVSQDDTV